MKLDHLKKSFENPFIDENNINQDIYFFNMDKVPFQYDSTFNRTIIKNGEKEVTLKKCENYRKYLTMCITIPSSGKFLPT